MLDFMRQTFGLQDDGAAGLPPSLLRPNSSLGDLDVAAIAGNFASPTLALPAGAALPGGLEDSDVRRRLESAPWARSFSCNFIEPGPVRYQGQNGAPDEWVMIEDDVLAKMAPSMVGKPIVDWDHAEVWPEMIGDGQADGVVCRVWKAADGWYWADFMVWTKSAVQHAASGQWSVSCAWATLKEDKQGGKYHNIPYTQRLLDGVYTHLALVERPRYEKARIRANAQDGNGGYKMAFSLFGGKKPEVLRLNSADRKNAVADMMLNVDGEPVKLVDMVNALKAKRNAEACDMLNAEDHDEVELDGEKFNVGELRAAHRANAAARKNAEDKAREEKEKKEREDRENAAHARQNTETQLKGAGSEKTGKLAGSGSAPQGTVEDNPDQAVQAAEALAKATERLNSLEKELAAMKAGRSEELAAAATMRAGPLGGAPEDRGPVTMEDRIRRGNADFALGTAA